MADKAAARDRYIAEITEIIDNNIKNGLVLIENPNQDSSNELKNIIISNTPIDDSFNGILNTAVLTPSVTET